MTGYATKCAQRFPNWGFPGFSSGVRQMPGNLLHCPRCPSHSIITQNWVHKKTQVVPTVYSSTMFSSSHLPSHASANEPPCFATHIVPCTVFEVWTGTQRADARDLVHKHGMAVESFCSIVRIGFLVLSTNLIKFTAMRCIRPHRTYCTGAIEENKWSALSSLHCPSKHLF